MSIVCSLEKITLQKSISLKLNRPIHSKNCFGSNMDKPKHWVKNVIKNVTQLLGLSIFDPNLV